MTDDGKAAMVNSAVAVADDVAQLRGYQKLLKLDAEHRTGVTRCAVELQAPHALAAIESTVIIDRSALVELADWCSKTANEVDDNLDHECPNEAAFYLYDCARRIRALLEVNDD